MGASDIRECVGDILCATGQRGNSNFAAEPVNCVRNTTCLRHSWTAYIRNINGLGVENHGNVRLFGRNATAESLSPLDHSLHKHGDFRLGYMDLRSQNPIPAYTCGPEMLRRVLRFFFES
jgi:hypothetical protein